MHTLNRLPEARTQDHGRRCLRLPATALAAMLLFFFHASAQIAPTVPLSVPPSEDEPTYSPTLTYDVASIREAPRVNGLAMNIDDPPHASAFRATGIPLVYLRSEERRVGKDGRLSGS